MSLINIISHLANHPLNRSNKSAAIVKFFRWQIGSRLLPGDVVIDWVNDSKFIAQRGEEGITGNIYCGLHEFTDMAFLLHTLRESDLFVDIGANVGSYTILACAAVGSRGYSVEPVPSTYEKLMNNIRINGLENRVVASNIELGTANGKIYFSSDKNCENHVLTENEYTKNAIEVKISTLDEELEQSPFLMKIDVEGYEYAALNGAEKTLKNDELCCVIMELNGSGIRYGFDESEIISMMHDLGFDTYRYEPFDRKLISLDGKNVFQGNTIFIRNLDRVVARIKDATTFDINGLTI